MKKTLLSLSLCLPALALAQTTYPIEKFSDIYSGQVTVIKQGDNNEFTLTIVDKDNKPVINLSPYAGFSEFDVNDKGEIKSNVSNPPYNEQNLIISQDVNFDGVADLAIRNGFNSCYGGPSYDIYLQQGDKLVHSPEFSALAQEYCGMFSVNNETKTLHTMFKSGSSRHQYTDFKVENGKPVAVKIVETEVLDSPLPITQYKEQNRINGQMVEKTYQKIAVLIDTENKEPKFGFVMDGSESAGEANVMFLLQGRDKKLHFILTDWQGVIKQHYDGGFLYQTVIDDLAFGIGQDTYIVTEEDMTVITPKKTVKRFATDMMKVNRLETAVKGATNVTVRGVPINIDPPPEDRKIKQQKK